MFKTVQALTNDVLQELSLVPGTSVQQYTEPLILTALNTAFQTLFKKRFWSHLTATTEHEVDPNAGLITDTLETIDDIGDIQWIKHYPFEDYCTLRFLDGEEYHNYMNPSFDALHFSNDQYTAKLIQLYPFDIQSPIRIRARRKVDPFVDEADIVPFDDVCMKHLTTMNMLAADGINPNAQQQQTILFNARYEDLTSNAANRVSYYGRGTGYASSFTVAED